MSEQRQASSPATNQTGLFRQLVEKSSSAAIVASMDGSIRYVNAAGGTLLELRGESANSILDIFDLEDRSFVQTVIVPEVERGGRWSGAFRLRSRISGKMLHTYIDFFRLDISGASEKAIALVVRDVSERHRADTHLQTLVEVGTALAHATDDRQILDVVAHIVVRRIATFCFVELFARQDERTHTVRIGVHADSTKNALLRDVSTFYAPIEQARASETVERILADGSSTLLADVDGKWIARNARDETSRAALRVLEPRSIITIPIVVRGKVIGLLTAAIGSEERPRADIPTSYDAEELFFVEEIGRRAGVAVDSVTAYNRQRTIASRFQAAALPKRLPSSERFYIDADYRPGTAELTVGGDWYDALIVQDGRLVLSIGDVLGHGLDAALSMTKLRQAMQAAALVAPEPDVMLAIADRTLQSDGPVAYATAAAIVYDPRDRSLRLANAGHPGLFLRHADGRVDQFSANGMMLGVLPDTRFDVRTIVVEPPFSMILYTDGITEVSHEIDAGERALRDAFATFDHREHAKPASALVDLVLQGRPGTDDIVLVYVRVEAATALSLDEETVSRDGM